MRPIRLRPAGFRMRRGPPPGLVIALMLGLGLVVVAALGFVVSQLMGGGAAPTAVATANPGGAVVVESRGVPPSAGGFVVLPTRTPVPPIDLGALNATAEALYARTPGARPPAAAPPPQPGVPTQTPLPTRTPLPTWTPTITGTPVFTRTPVPTGTPTSTATSSPTPSETGTPTPTPAPCEARIEVPRLQPGNGFYFTFFDDGSGAITANWNAVGGTILLYPDKPVEFGDAASGVAIGVSAVKPIAEAKSGRDTLFVPDRTPGTYTAYFYDSSNAPMGPNNATLQYLTIGHCP